MNEQTKRILLIVGFILSVIIIAIVMYRLFFAGFVPEATVHDTDETTTTTTTLPFSTDGVFDSTDGSTTDGSGVLTEADDVANGSVTSTTTLTTGEVHNIAMNTDGSSVNYYDETDGRFYTIDEDGNVVRMSDTQFPDVDSVVWNKDAEKAVLEFPDGSNVIYNFDSEQQVTLPQHWEDFDFSPVDDEIIAKSIGLDPANRWLLTANDDGSNIKSFQALGENEEKVDVNWSPNDQVVAFADTAGSAYGGLNRTMIYPVGLNDENFKGLVVEGLDFMSLWSPNGKQLLYSVVGDYSDSKPLLWIVDATASTMGENRRSLGLNTWVDKCTWGSSSMVYCAVPQDLPANAGLQRSLFDQLPDVLYSINFNSGRTSLLAIPEEETAMTNLSVSSDESKLYYTNDSGQLELILLK
jgi:hypothetical protein